MKATVGPFTRLGLLMLPLLLTVLGVAFVHSTDLHSGDFPGQDARSQIVKACVGVCAFVIISRFDYRLWDRYAYVLFVGLMCVLAVMLAAKFSRGGILRSINLRVFQIQPSELMKIALVLVLARYLRFREDQHRLRGLVIPFSLTVLPMALVLLQPDLGTSLMFPPILLGMLFVAGARWKYLLAAIVIGASLLPTAYFAYRIGVPIVREYQYERIAAFLFRGEASRQDDGYQLDQSEIAIGSGGFLGKGYGLGTQNRLDFLPERHTDFIFSVIAEELGFVGAALSILGFFLLVVMILRVAIYAREPFGRLLATGVGVGFAAQGLQNIGMAMGLTPITGLTLPFVSYGGSSLVSSYAAVALVYAVASRRVSVMASPDLTPRDEPRSLHVVDERPSGLLHHT